MEFLPLFLYTAGFIAESYPAKVLLASNLNSTLLPGTHVDRVEDDVDGPVFVDNDYFLIKTIVALLRSIRRWLRSGAVIQ